MNAQRLGQRLKLDQAQQAQIEPLLEEYAQAAREIQEKTPQDLRERRRELMKQMREARKARDKDKMKALSGEMQELRKNDPQAAEMQKLRQDVVSKIESILRDDQKEALHKLVKIRGARKPSLSNPGFLRRCLGQLELRPDQKTELKKIDKEFKEAMKGLGKDAPAEKRREMSKQYCDEVMKVLDAPQKQQLEEIAKTMPAGPPPRMMNPKALEKALAALQLTPEQQTNIDALTERYKTDRREAGKDKRAQRDLTQKLIQDVMAQLDDAQKQELMKHGGKKPRKRRGRSGETETP